MEKTPEKKIHYNSTSWYCPVCLNNKDYKLHQRNKDFLKLENEIMELKSEIEFWKPKTSAEVTLIKTR